MDLPLPDLNIYAAVRLPELVASADDCADACCGIALVELCVRVVDGREAGARRHLRGTQLCERRSTKNSYLGLIPVPLQELLERAILDPICPPTAHVGILGLARDITPLEAEARVDGDGQDIQKPAR